MKAVAGIFLLPMLCAVGASADPVAFDFSSLGTSQINFDGTSATFNFSPDASGFDFSIADSSLAGLVGLNGNIDGTFTIGSIASFGFLQDAPVSGSGVYSIS